MNGEDLGSFIPKHGGYAKLRSFRAAQRAYDCTVVFCSRFVPKSSRTYDQMIQAARSGVQNIAEGSLASATSKGTEIKLTNVARASLGELLLDYDDFLRQRGLEKWPVNDPRVVALRARAVENRELTSEEIAACDPEEAANSLICLINQAMCLLKHQIRTLEREFLRDGGIRERMTAMRREHR